MLKNDYLVSKAEIVALRNTELLEGYRKAGALALSMMGEMISAAYLSVMQHSIRADDGALVAATHSVKSATDRFKSMKACQDVMLMLREWDFLVRDVHETMGHVHNACFNFDTNFSPEEKLAMYAGAMGYLRVQLSHILIHCVPELEPDRLAREILSKQGINPDQEPTKQQPSGQPSPDDLRFFLAGLQSFLGNLS